MSKRHKPEEMVTKLRQVRSAPRAAFIPCGRNVRDASQREVLGGPNRGHRLIEGGASQR